MAKYYYYSITVIISLYIIASCAPESTLTGNGTVYQLNVTVDPAEAGNVTPSSAELTERVEVEITASPNEGWVFDRWQGDHTGSENPVTITMDREKDILALFIKSECPLTIIIEGEGTVTERMIQDPSSPHQAVDLTASPSEGWEFIRWDDDLSGDQNPQTIIIDANKAVIAIFEEETSLFSGGDGSKINPFQVSNVEELQRIASYHDAHFVQINNIDASATAFWNTGKGFNPIGNFESPFEGTYDGGEFKISDLTINRGDEKNVALFGFGYGATIKNTGVVNVSIIGHDDVGGLVGTAFSGTEIENSYATGNVTGNSNVGGLAGRISGILLFNSHAIVEVSGDIHVGGLVGFNGSPGSRMFNSYAEGNVSGIRHVGGLIGENNRRNSIYNTYATGTVTGTGGRIGGLIGFNASGSHINSSFATGAVSGNDEVGGLVGRDGGSGATDSYAAGNVSGSSMVGGLIGKIVGPGIIDRSHASGNVSGISLLGGLVGSKYSTHINDCFAVGEITGEDKIGGLAGVSIAGQIKNSYALGRVNGKNVVGGLVGVNDTGGHIGVHDAGKIYHSYAHGVVTGDGNVGGLAGINRNHAVITTSYAKGMISGEENTGGIVGLNEAGIVSSYWDSEAAGQRDGAGDGSTDGTTGLTTSEMTGDSAETNMPEYDWSSIWVTTSEYPILKWQDGNLTSN